MVLLLMVAMNSLGNSVFNTYAYAAKSGQNCAKSGLKSGSLVCTKVKGKLIWQLGKKQQTLSVQFPLKASLSSTITSISFSASSGLPVTAVSIFPTICTIANKTVSFISLGYCMIRLTQSGNSQFFSATKKDIKILIVGSNQISFTPPSSLLLSTSTYQLTGTSSSGLSLTYESLTADICSVSESTLTLIKLGLCTIRASQSGSDIYESAQSVEASITIQGSNQISFSPVTSLLLSTKTYPLAGTSTSGLPLTYESLTPDICSVSAAVLTLTKLGLCTIRASQSGSNLYEAAKYVDGSITISDTRVTSDQPDTVTGFQIKAIYVVPSDGVDQSYDTNGYIAGILDEGNSYLRAQIGLSVPIDKNATGYDIQYMKSKLTTAYFLTASYLTDDLLAESMDLENPGINRKDYMFFIDVNVLRDGTACGYAGRPGISAVVAIGKGVVNGKTCTGKALNFADYAAAAWPHELFHNFGVSHTPDDPCDFMAGSPETSGTCPSTGALTIDKERSHYVGKSIQGQDILQLRVWEGYTSRLDLAANCFLTPVARADGMDYAYCPTGTQTIGALKSCWSSINSVTLEEFVNGAWTSLGSGNHFSEPWGPKVYWHSAPNTWKCNTVGYTAPWKQLTVTTPGISLYRWMINGTESEQFKVIWVR